MKETIEKTLISEGLENVQVICFEGLAFKEALKHNSTFIVKGIRNGMDYEDEEAQATNNDRIGGIDTIYIRSGDLGIISSSMVMELLKWDEDVSKFIPKVVLEAITKK